MARILVTTLVYQSSVLSPFPKLDPLVADFPHPLEFARRRDQTLWEANEGYQSVRSSSVLSCTPSTHFSPKHRAARRTNASTRNGSATIDETPVSVYTFVVTCDDSHVGAHSRYPVLTTEIVGSYHDQRNHDPSLWWFPGNNLAQGNDRQA